MIFTVYSSIHFVIKTLPFTIEVHFTIDNCSSWLIYYYNIIQRVKAAIHQNFLIVLLLLLVLFAASSLVNHCSRYYTASAVLYRFASLVVRSHSTLIAANTHILITNYFSRRRSNVFPFISCTKQTKQKKNPSKAKSIRISSKITQHTRVSINMVGGGNSVLRTVVCWLVLFTRGDGEIMTRPIYIVSSHRQKCVNSINCTKKRMVLMRELLVRSTRTTFGWAKCIQITK